MSTAPQARTGSDDRSLAAEIARALAARIVSGDLAPGATLRQDRVAAEHGASHVPVREAFRRLEARGLVVSEPRRGVRVAPLRPQDVREVVEMRAALEALALREATPRLTESDLAAARAALIDGERGEDIAGWEDANRRFHRALLDPCAMPRLIGAIADLHEAAARHLFLTWRDLGWRPRSAGEHRAILAAVEARRAEEASALVAEHVAAAGRALAAALEGALATSGEAGKSVERGATLRGIAPSRSPRGR